MKLRTIKSEDKNYTGMTVIDFGLRYFELDTETSRVDIPVTLGLTPNGRWIAITLDGDVDNDSVEEYQPELVSQALVILAQTTISKL